MIVDSRLECVNDLIKMFKSLAKILFQTIIHLRTITRYVDSILFDLATVSS